MQYHLEPEYYALIDMISQVDVEISKHSIATYTLDELERYAKSFVADDQESGIFIVDRRPSVLNNQLYEVMDIKHKVSKGYLRLFGKNIPMPASYSPIKLDEEKDDDEN